jgi:hypothetical protein
MTVTAVVKQVEGDKYPTSSLVLSFMNYQCMSVSNMYVKTSGRTWRIGGSQIWTRTGRDEKFLRTREKWKTRMDKSSIVSIWTNSWLWVPHPWISTWSLSKGKPSFKRTCKSNRCPTTQTLWCGGSTDWFAREPSGHHHDWPDVG